MACAALIIRRAASAAATADGTAFYDEGDLTALAAAGHEIGCHGFAHQPTPALSDEELAADADAQPRIPQALPEWRARR